MERRMDKGLERLYTTRGFIHFQIIRNMLNSSLALKKIILMWHQKILNVSSRVLENVPCTTNCLGGFHRALNNLFIRVHPDLGLFGEELLKENLLSKKKILHAFYDEKTKVLSKKEET